jgi:hypothetical protein
MFFYKIDETWKGLPVLNLELHYRKKYKKRFTTWKGGSTV